MTEEAENLGDILDKPLSIRDLISAGTHFQVRSDYNEDAIPDDLLIGLDDQSDEEDEDTRKSLITPWDKSFNELRKLMRKVNDHIYKRITIASKDGIETPPPGSRVIIKYNAYWENEKVPFDSSFLRGDESIFYCGRNEVLEGLDQAVMTMRKGEEAQFIISYHLLFREMGCPPRVKPKADGLYIIKLLNFTEVGDENALDSVPQEDLNKFSVVHQKVKDIHLKGLDFYKLNKISAATRTFHKAVNALEFCRLQNAEEEEEQRQFLVKLYVNLAVCYNKMNLPRKACCMCNEIRRISNMNGNCKALFQEGRALLNLGEFDHARTALLKAQRLEPRNDAITQEIKMVSQKYSNYKETERLVCQRAFQMVDTNAKSHEEKGSKFNSKFKDGIKEYLEEFKNNTDLTQLALQKGFSPTELECIEEVANDLNLKLSIEENHVRKEKNYFVRKN